jgi:class I fructose-bisphosphate aldolase
MSTRLRLANCGLSAGKKARLHRILYKHGLGNGTALFLPYDQRLEHGPRDFFADPVAADPRYIVKLALEGGFNGIAIQIGLAEKFFGRNVWQRDHDESLRLVDRLREILAKYPTP